MASPADLVAVVERIRARRAYNPGQKRDAKGRWTTGGTGGLPAGWKLGGGWAGADQHPNMPSVVSADGRCVVASSVWDFAPELESQVPLGAWDHPKVRAARATMQAAVEEVAAHVDQLQATNDPGPHITKDRPLRVDIRDLGGGKHAPAGTTEMSDGRQITVNARLWTDPDYRAAAEAAGDRGFLVNGPVIESVVSHEYGHVLAFGGREKAGDHEFYEEGVVAPLVARADDQTFFEMTEYARSDPREAYAEAFSAWAQRDTVRPPTLALQIAEREGWK